MINEQYYIAELISRYIAGSITPEEEIKLNEWRESSPQHEKLFQDICSTETFEQYFRSATQFDKQRGWEQLNQKMRFLKRKSRLLKLCRYAAIFMLPLVLGVFLVNTLAPYENSIAEQMEKQNIQILPGEKKATLTLGSGTVIDLKKTPATTVEEEDGTAIAIDAENLNYRQEKAVKTEKIIYNQIDVPHGGEYSLLLSDGTRVHLNSMTTLRFPVRFVEDRRVVELNGEAYFEVTPHTKPFIVRVDGMEIEVLGTVFNISSYQQQNHQTTLVEGSVKVRAADGNSCVLKPSEQAYMKQDSNKLGVRKVDVMEYTSWINGKIYFKDARLEDIMDQLARWYDIDVFYLEPSVKNVRFGCNVNRYKEITPFLELLEKTDKVDISIQGKTITFKHNN